MGKPDLPPASTRPASGPGSRGGSRVVVTQAVRNYDRRVRELEATLGRLRDLYRRRSEATHDMYSNNMECVPDCPRCAAETAVWEALAGV